MTAYRSTHEAGMAARWMPPWLWFLTAFVASIFLVCGIGAAAIRGSWYWVAGAFGVALYVGVIVAGCQDIDRYWEAREKAFEAGLQAIRGGRP